MHNGPDDPDDPDDTLDPDEPKPPSTAVADLFPFDELSTGETSSLLKRAKLVTGFQDDPVPEVDPSLKPTTGRFLALKAAASGTHQAYKPGTGSQPAHKPSAPLPPRPGGTGSMPAFKAGTGTQPAYNPSAPRPGTGTQPAYNPSAPRQGTWSQPANNPSAPRPGTGTQPAYNPSAPRPGTGAHAALAPSDLQREIKSRSRHDAAVAPPPGAKPGRPVKPPLAAEDTFVKKKIRQAENNLPDWDFDGDDEEPG